MTDSFRRAGGRKLISRSSAQDLGSVAHLLVDAERRQITAVVVGRGKKARLVDWSEIGGFGPDAVMVSDESALRPPADDRERLAADGKLELLGQRAISELGNAMGTIDDVTFDPVTGALENLRVGDREVPAGAMLGSGSYAVVLADHEDPLP
ncbi:MAG: hypothetical protein QOG43_2162 [Actinomycetota bacterium]|jgi:sporulation protein YlmC with PRC-barrel domain|nr:hypothetical protein [Actinomycetota bacterium]